MDIVLYYFIIIFVSAADNLWSMLPYILAGTIIGETLRFVKWKDLIVKGMISNPVLSVFIAVLLGIISPLCTYGTVPVVLELYRSGLPIAPIVAFLVSSSMINPQLFIMTWGGISLEFALARLAMVAVFGVFVGLISNSIPEAWIVNKKVAFNRKAYNEGICSTKPLFSLKLYLKNIVKSLEFVGYYIVIGVILGSIVETLIPGHVIQYFYGTEGWKSILLVSIISIPVYVCGGGAIPFINSLIESGMGKGTAAAFFNVGSVTRIPVLMALVAVIRPVFIVSYILLLIVFS